MPTITTLDVRISGMLAEFVASNIGEGGAYTNVRHLVRASILRINS